MNDWSAFASWSERLERRQQQRAAELAAATPTPATDQGLPVEASGGRRRRNQPQKRARAGK